MAESSKSPSRSVKQTESGAAGGGPQAVPTLINDLAHEVITEDLKIALGNEPHRIDTILLVHIAATLNRIEAQSIN